MNKNFILFYLLTALVCLTVFEVDLYQASTLFICIAGLLWALAKRPNTLVPPVAFIVVAYVLGFAGPALLPDLYATRSALVSSSALEYGMLWAVRGFGAFALGYALVEHLGKRVRARRLREDGFPGADTRYTLYILTSIGWLAILSWFASVMMFGISLTFIEGNTVTAESDAGSLLQILTLLSSFRNPFFLGFIVLYFRGQSTKGLYLIFVGLVLISVVEIITIGSKGSIIRGIVTVLLASALPLRVNPKSLITGALALIVVYGSFAVITEYRSIMRDELVAGRDVFSLSVQTESFIDAFTASLPFSDAAANRRTRVTNNDVFGRFGAGGISSFANLLEFTGRQAPHEHAWESFLIPVYSIVPRSFLPSKPAFFDSARNARDYYDWPYGGVSVSLLGSFYFAWGYIGIIFGMAVLGGLLAYIVKKAEFLGINSPQWLILLAVLIVSMMDVGETFHAITSNIIRIALVLFLLQLSYRRVRKQKRMSRIAVSPQRQTHT